MDAEQLEHMNSIKASLEDILNSQEAILSKVGQLEVKLMNKPDKEVEKGLADIFSNSSDNAELVKEVLEKFELRLEQANKEYKPSPEPGE